MKKYHLAAVLLTLLVSVLLLNIYRSLAQGKAPEKTPDEPKNVKVLEEKTDKEGYIYRTVQYKEGAIVTTQTIVIPPFPGLKDRKPVNIDTLDPDSVMVLVDKTNYLVAVLYKRKRIRQYRAVFGPDRLKDKMREGDRSTPEGWFKIVQKKDHNNWQKFCLLDYPNETSYTRFAERKKNHEIPVTANIGGLVGIHGTFKGGDQLVDMGIGWTDGCVALKSTDITDFYKFVQNGTKVYVRR